MKYNKSGRGRNTFFRAVQANGKRLAALFLALLLMASAIAFAISGTYAREDGGLDAETAAEQEGGYAAYEDDTYN